MMVINLYKHANATVLLTWVRVSILAKQRLHLHVHLPPMVSPRQSFGTLYAHLLWQLNLQSENNRQKKKKKKKIDFILRELLVSNIFFKSISLLIIPSVNWIKNDFA